MKYLVIALAALALSACAQFRALYGFDAAEIDTANEVVATGFVQVDQLRILTQNLLARDVITADQAQRVKDRLDQAFDTLEATRIALATSGDPIAADTTLAQARSFIALALGILNEVAPVQTAAALQRSESHGYHADCREGVAHPARRCSNIFRRWGAQPIG